VTSFSSPWLRTITCFENAKDSETKYYVLVKLLYPTAVRTFLSRIKDLMQDFTGEGGTWVCPPLPPFPKENVSPQRPMFPLKNLIPQIKKGKSYKC